MGSDVKMIERTLLDEYFFKFPKDAARVLDAMPPETIINYLSAMPPEAAGSIFFRLNSETISECIPEMDDRMFVQFFAKGNTHRTARLLSRHDRAAVSEKLALLPDIVSREIQDFMNYKEGTAGYLMETSLITFHPDNSVDDVLTRLRRIGNRNVMVVYIVDAEGALLGKIPVQHIAISQPDVPLDSLMDNAPSVDAMSTREEVLSAIEKGHLLQIPVTDINNNLLGVIRNEALMSASKKEISENLQAMFGAGREEQALSKISFAVRKRLPWLQVNLATAFLASMVVGLFEDTIAKITILAIFLPVVAGQSGNTGSQALAVTIRGLALKEIRISQWFKVARKELMVGLINGIAVALTTGIIVYFWSSSSGIAIVIGISMIISMLIAGFAGAIIPIALKAIGQDPATSSSIILTTVTDICGFLSFLGLATALSSVLGIV
ncbi:magnesium transporter [Pricia sp. S334]|uniref:Magnesium transporter MgtE n=1 Tax=Pricia mediterranea TaxID=3076079 RepID=A0ABU3L6K3_9FLAO|nr:magnesium transporter [Pricia sp. S334]MDT7829290.1 magnesium transporter [Pricia sp. S334]